MSKIINWVVKNSVQLPYGMVSFDGLLVSKSIDFRAPQAISAFTVRIFKVCNLRFLNLLNLVFYICLLFITFSSL